MADDDRPAWKLPISPLALQARHDRHRASVEAMAERHGPDALAWPPLECSRLMSEMRDIDIALQVNWQFIYANADRLGLSRLDGDAG